MEVPWNYISGSLLHHQAQQSIKRNYLGKERILLPWLHRALSLQMAILSSRVQPNWKAGRRPGSERATVAPECSWPWLTLWPDVAFTPLRLWAPYLHPELNQERSSKSSPVCVIFVMSTNHQEDKRKNFSLDREYYLLWVSRQNDTCNGILQGIPLCI